jgi:outer membrane protein assembly factor BamB
MKVRLVLPAFAFMFASTAALATTTRFLRQTTAKDFEEGEAVSSMVLPTGEVVAGLKTTRLSIDAAFAWCTALSPDGHTAFFGTGDQGRIFSVAMASGEAKKLADIDAPWVTALAARGDGSLLAGATPGGRVFAVDGKGSRPFAKLPVEHVWALLVAGKGTVTYAATGSPGQIFVIDQKGKERLLWDAGDKHVMALADGGNGTMLAGTADQAILYRVHTDGHAEALQDFDGNEIRAIVRSQGATYVAVNAFERGAEAGNAGHPVKNNRPAPGPSPASGAQPRSDQVKAHAGVYRLDDSGRLEQVLSLADGYFTSLVAGADGHVYAGSGAQGKVYRISPDRNVALALDLPERQVLSMAAGAQGFLVGTGDAGAIFRTHATASGDFSYVSKVLDADSLAQWGFVHWTGTANLVLETRVGNTAKPDKSWSPWTRLQAHSHQGQEGQGKVVGPQTRYLQYRVVLPGKSSLREVLAYFLPQNQRARITEISLAEPTPAPAATGGTPATPSAAATRTHSPTLKLRWKVENPDNDELIYKLWFRQDNETLWRPLGGPDPLSKPEYDWNSESVPDGRYLIRVWASDEKVTPKDQALDFTLDSPTFLVDNNRPIVSELRAQLPLLHGRAHDSASVISQIEYAIDGNEWRPATADNGILDETSEAFSIRLPSSLAPGPHIINVRAWDSADNLGTARIQVQIGR